jgi:hypothetical protein
VSYPDCTGTHNLLHSSQTLYLSVLLLHILQWIYFSRVSYTKASSESLMQCFGVSLETWCLYWVLFRQWLFYIIDKLQQLLCWCRLSVRRIKCGQKGVTVVSRVEGDVCARSNVEVLEVATLQVGIRQTHERRPAVNMS